MKKKFLFLSAIACGALLAACSSDELVDNSFVSEGQQEIKHISVTLPDMVFAGDDDDATTRAEFTYKPATDAFGFAWSSGDVMGVFPNKGAQVDFPIDEKFVGTNSAEFDGGGWALKAGYKYAVYYPYSYNNTDKTALPMKYTGQTQLKANDYSHLNKFNYFSSKESITADNSGLLSFNVGYMGTIVWMPFTFDFSGTLKEIRLVSDNLPFITQANLDISGDKPTFTPVIESNTISLKLNDIAVTAGEESNFYMWILPRDYRESKITAEVVTSTDKVYAVTLYNVNGNSNLESGSFKRYRRPNTYFAFAEKAALEQAKEISALNDLYNALGKPAALANWTLNKTKVSEFSGTGVKVEGEKVTEIDLHDMGLTGYIPASIGDLTDLQKLDLSGNNLSGDVPSLTPSQSSTSYAPAAGGNSIPATIGNLVNLKWLSLGGNKLTGNIPTTIGNLTKLEYMSFSGNQLDGTIPSAIGNLTKLTVLELSNNKLDGEMPATIGNLTSLTVLNISSNKIDGSIPTTIGQLTSLTVLNIGNNQLSGELPSSMENLTQLEQLQAGNNDFQGGLPTWVSGLPLTTLDLSNNDFTGDFVKWFFEEITSIPTLQDLNLGGNQLDGEVTDEMKESERWQSLDNINIQEQQGGHGVEVEEIDLENPSATIESFTESDYEW